MIKRTAIIDCPHCTVRIKAEAISWIQIEEDTAYALVQCPTCKNPLFGIVSGFFDEFNNWEWDTATRLWPDPSIVVHDSIPRAARRDILDAQKCYAHGIYSATAVLCGRALERLIKEKAGDLMIGKGIQKLKDDNIIDARLFTWAEALRKERNIGAHATTEETTKENAQDVLDFTVAIFDYVYTLSTKYQNYLSRKSAASLEQNKSAIDAGAS